MPVFFQQQINDHTRLGIWKIEETESFFKGTVPLHRDVTHPHKRLQHLAGRFLLQFLFPGFPYDLIRLADTRKPFLPGQEYQFSISHCGDYAAAIVSRGSRVGIDIEIPVPAIGRIAGKFLGEEERKIFEISAADPDIRLLTTLWSGKEAVFKWYGEGQVDFSEHIRIQGMDVRTGILSCHFTKNDSRLQLHYHQFEQIVLVYVVSEA